MRTVDEWKTRLRAALRDAQRAREPHAVAVLRETLAAIDNAEAADLRSAPSGQSHAIAGAVDGLGAGEVPRRELGPEDVAAIIERELLERRTAAASYASLGRREEADALRRQADLLEALTRSTPGTGL
jgi:uncharacterized protein YqeY